MRVMGDRWSRIGRGLGWKSRTNRPDRRGPPMVPWQAGGGPWVISFRPDYGPARRFGTRPMVWSGRAPDGVGSPRCTLNIPCIPSFKSSMCLMSCSCRFIRYDHLLNHFACRLRGQNNISGVRYEQHIFHFWF